ncbi:MAG: metal ABC transporter ATP-binding protein [Pseudomonadota bacterium]
MPSVLTLDNLTVTHQRHPVVHHLSGSVPRGSLTAIVGPNGAGKSSLLDALVGRLPATTGKITLASDVRGHVGYLPQQSHVDRSFPIRVLDLVQLGAWRWLGAWRAATARTRTQALAALEAVGMAQFENRLMGELSVGQFQRVLFARLLMQDARLILLDEPFNAIDARTCDDLLAVVQRWHAEGRTVVAVLHDLAQVRRHFEHTLLLAREPVAWGPTAEVLTPENLNRALHMATHWDENAAHCHRPAPAGRVELPATDHTALTP